MKTIFNKIISRVGLALFMACSVISCADNDFTSQLEVGGDVLSEGIEAEIDGKLTTLNIASNDKWTIDVPKEATHWLYVPVKSGQGNMNVPISIDANFGSSFGRNAVITITAGNVVKKVEVNQVPTYKGQTVANSDEALDYVTIAATKGVGLGLNLNSLSSKDCVINLKAIEELQKINKSKYSFFFTYNKENEAGARGAVIDSVDTKKDSLGVSLSCDINYGDFKLNIGGAYHGDESKDTYSTEYKYGATYNIANASIDLKSLVASYYNAFKTEETSDEQNWLRLLLSPGFVAAKEMVEEAYNDNDDEYFNSAMEDLIDSYGPVVIAGCDLGSSISLWMKYNRDSIADIMHVDTAHVKVAIESGLLKVGGGVEVSYKKEGIKVLENSAFKYHISGGAQIPQNAVSNILSTTREKGDSDVVYNVLHEKLDAWIASLDANDPATLTYTRLKIYPIWSLFQGKVKFAITKWIKANYKDKLGIITNEVIDADVSGE